LIFRINVGLQRNYRYCKEGNDPDVLDAYPAQELVETRDDWLPTWEAAGGFLVSGRMATLKSSSVWAQISIFSLPYPPFDLNDETASLQDIGRREAVALGLITNFAEVCKQPIPRPAKLYCF